MSTSTKKRPAAKAHEPSPLDILRRVSAQANREKHEAAYFWHVCSLLQVEGYPLPKTQALLIPGRRYRFDFAFIEARLAVEVSGQIWHKGGHTSGRGVTRDADKLNHLTCIGWHLLIFTPEMIEDGTALDFTRRALRRAGLRGAA